MYFSPRYKRLGCDFVDILKDIRPSERVIKLFSHLVFSEWDKSIEEKNVKRIY